MAATLHECDGRRGQDGAAAVEFALDRARSSLLLIFGMVQYGIYFYAMQAGTAAVGEATGG